MRQIIQNNFFMLKWIGRFRPSHLFITLVDAIVTNIVSLYGIILIGTVVDAIIKAKNFSTIMLLLGCFALIRIVHSVLNAWVACVLTPKNVQIIREKMQSEIFDRAAQIQYTCFEDAEFYNQYHLAMQQSDTRAIAVLRSFSETVGSLFGMVTFVSYISTVDSFSIIVVSISVSISIFFSSMISTIQKKYVIDNAPRERVSSYIQRLFTKKEYAKEIRVFPSFSALLHHTFSQNAEGIKNSMKKCSRSLFHFNSVQSVNSTASDIVIMGYYAYKVFSAMIQISDFVILVNAAQKLTEQTITLFGIVPDFYEHSIYIDHFRYFMEKTPLTSTNPECHPFPQQPSVEFKNVSFRYPGSMENTLYRINITIPYGSKVALVGPNGAGKSTMIKLLSRLYVPCEGQMTVNGTDYQSFNYNSTIDSLSVVFQDYQLYDMSIAENILMKPFTSEDLDTVHSALHMVGLYDKVIKLPDGILTILSKEFCSKGTLFSGGEYQRLAIARIYAKKSSIIIMDEPSAALDPIAERSVLEAVLRLSTGKTLILISHKLYQIKNADQIFVMDHGKVVEHGNHQALLAEDGMYAQMYHQQMAQF